MPSLRRILFAIALLALFPFSSAAKDEKWIEARSANFIVVTNGSAQQARTTAIQFEQIRELFQRSFAFASDRPSPVITILAAKDENTLKSLLPEYWETKGRAHPAGIFLDNLYQLQVAVQLSGQGDNPYEAIYHEYYHSLTVPYFPSLPVWISEGLADFYGNSKVVDKMAYMGVPDANLIEFLHQQSLIPLATLFHVDHASPYYNEGNKVSMFYAESWALIHYLMMGENGAHRAQLMTYLDGLSKGLSQEEASTKAFGDIGKLQKALESYTNNPTFYEMHTAAPPKIAEDSVKIRQLTDAESSAYRGGFLALHGRFKEADPLLQDAVHSEPKLALAQQSLAVSCDLQQKYAEARQALDAAIESDPANALTRYLRANLNSEGSGSELHDSEIEADLRAAVQANPNFAPPYSLLASRLATKGQKPQEAFEFAKKSVVLEPGVGYYQFVLAEVLARAHQYDQAQVVASRLAANSLSPSDKENANRLMQFIQDARNFDARRGGTRTMAGNTPSSAPAAEPAKQPMDSTDDDDDDTPNDGKSRVDGTVTDVQCKVQDMIIVLATSDGTMKLHATDNTKVDYVSDVQLKSEVFWPCTSLKGHTVRIKYLPVPANAKQAYQGELAGVEIRK